MAANLRCRITGCDPDECGVCRRCGSAGSANHKWVVAERREPCFELRVCERCNAERQKPDHDWTPAGADGVQGPALKCSRCRLTI